MSLVSLNTLSVGEQAYVNKLGFGANDRRRMQDIGLIDGTRVECLGKAISGDPAAYLIRGAVIALRSEDAAKIAVSKICRRGGGKIGTDAHFNGKAQHRCKYARSQI